MMPFCMRWPLTVCGSRLCPLFDGAYIIDEVVHVSTIKPLLKSIVKILQNMDKME